LLTIDGVVNLVLGLLLALLPRGFAKVVGIPIPPTPCYPIILGGAPVGKGRPRLNIVSWAQKEL